MKRILMIAYHFPPLAGSSGIQRTLRFVQHLPAYGWEPIVLSAHPRAYERTSDDLMSEVPEGVVVSRAFALDTARHLSLKGRYIGALARPDRWMSWKFDGVREGMRLIRKYRPDVIWSTYPIASAHVIGAELQRRTGLPWVADFRDPMAQDGYPSDPETYRQFIEIEKTAVERATVALFTTPGAARVYRERYPASVQKISVLENGYDEQSFVQAESDISGDNQPLNPGMFTFLHSGIVYPAERDPTQLFLALAKLRQNYPEIKGKLKIRFRASVHENLLHRLAKINDVEALIETMPPIGYNEALREMLRADCLLVMQAANCNDQIPAKIYEYLRTGKPILGLTDHAGDTANLLRSFGCAPIADLVNVDELYAVFERVVYEKENAFKLPDVSIVCSASRERRVKKLAELLNDIN